MNLEYNFSLRAETSQKQQNNTDTVEWRKLGHNSIDNRFLYTDTTGMGEGVTIGFIDILTVGSEFSKLLFGDNQGERTSYDKKQHKLLFMPVTSLLESRLSCHPWRWPPCPLLLKESSTCITLYYISQPSA